MRSKAGRRVRLVCVGSAEDDFLDAGRSYPLSGVGSVLFGRAKAGPDRSAELFVGLALPWVSAAHAELTRVGGPQGRTFTLRDLGSRNGTHVQHRRIEAPVAVSPGEVFEIGRTFWTIRDDAAEPEAHGDEQLLPPLCHVVGALAAVANTRLAVLVQGEIGVGKAAVARWVHHRRGARGAFVIVDLAKEEAGQRLAALEAGLAKAGNGTLYLTGIEQVSRAAQQRIAGMLERRAPDGSPVGLVAASSVDLRTWASSGRLAPELFDRLRGMEVVVPPLRERPEDIGRILRAMAVAAPASPRGVLRLQTRAFRWMLSFAWPFNRRQLTRVLTVLDAMRTDEHPIDLDAVKQAVAPARMRTGGPTHLSELLP